MIILVGIGGAAALLVVRLDSSLSANLNTSVSQQVETLANQATQSDLPRPLPAAGDGTAVVQVVDTRGQVVTSSVNIDGQGRLFSIPGAKTEPALATVHNVPIGDDSAAYRVAAMTVTTKTGTLTLYAGLPTSDVAQSVSELTGALAVGVPVVVIVLAFVGWLVIGRALRPVEALREQAAAIPGSGLHRRLDLPPSDDELGRLARTLNDLLGRIETATGRHRQFVADAAHELRSPVTSLRTQLEVAIREPRAAVPPDLLEDTVRLSRLIDDLLVLARLDANPAPHRQPVDLDDLVLKEARRARAQNRRSIDTAGVSAGRVLGDPHVLSRVVRNLVDNGLRHAATTVTLQLAVSGNAVVLTVADDGPGIPPTDRDRVFERFTRLDDARSRDAGGSGLGLAIVHDVITAYGGTVRIEDNHPGARIVIALPAA